MGSVGFKELLVILIVVLVIFGGRRLPELGKGLGRGLSNFRRAINDKREGEEQSNSSSTSQANDADSGEPKA
ncbi:MAG: twin-arginine translocase TatA/TatE family subunit [Deltaproteobacteria bacterium]|jgi:sec-independent protein translocase protein TatA|nr:twin-arginine translocase TatA/TatE family subunit [Deltaproteobacteria bacterium]